ncbi:Nif11-like leader peptide family natural product precursor [Scytonema hofmannii PCC 7110]|uniref:Nif11-like leader peptide family natural product n=1 Tax=Scytonema hofmannii PCC 7110 TaxID=128403 RepID=A0A139X7I1_9CYAN|nr:Nif11-like leader peptide family natural product precursor [Scytonema hofmannii]KYC40658.1 Nif11-like leader peptide family natural product precursor [Scytonema hofmannii PCC 7110]
MSIESARAFYERIVTDEAFKTQYQNAVSDDERREIVLAAGYNFTPEEWEAAMTQISESSDEELSDAELTAVSGGASVLLGKLPKRPIVYPFYGGPRL